MKKILVITDNQVVYDYLSKEKGYLLNLADFTFCFTDINNEFCKKYANDDNFNLINVSEPDQIIKQFELVISWHCKKIFPQALVENVCCINIHPGLNPYNRGWFPQVFSILNKKPCGATIHLIDTELDHGAVIAQKEVPIKEYDTSESAYQKIMEAEFALFESNIVSIVNGSFTTFCIQNEGNLNTKKDFNQLLELDLNQTMTLRESIDLFRALTFKKYKNAYFISRDNKKIFVSINLEPADLDDN